MAAPKRKTARKRPGQQARRTTTRGRPAHATPSPWLYFTGGLGLGLFVALLVWLNGQPQPELGTGLKSLLARRPAPASDVRAVKRPPPIPAPKPAPPQPRYDFYTVLPEFEQVLPDGEVQPLPPNREVRYILQAASYANFRDAEALQAKLALNGLEAQIEKVSIENRGDYYRVRLGPYDNLGELDRVNRRLAGLGIRALRLRLGGR